MTRIIMLQHIWAAGTPLIAIISLWSLSLATNSFVEAKIRSDEEILLEYLFYNYNPSARPVLNSSKTVTVSLKFALLQIQDLNVRSQVFTTTGLLILDWRDERLTWDERISSLDEIVIDGKSIWKPEFAVINGAEGIYEDFSDFQAVLKSDGSIHWEPGGVFKTMCSIDITYYPFDAQKCDLQFGAWSYYTSKMNLTTNATQVGKESYELNGEWSIAGTSVSRHEFFFDCCPDEKFSNILFSINLRRRHTFYIMNVILPGIMTSAVLLSIFFCTPTQKVHIGVASLLSFRLFLLNVADTIPRTSDHVPLLGIYLTSTMAITTLAMVATVFVLNLYGMKEKPVPPWAKRIFVGYLSRILCMCDCVAPVEKLVKEELELQYTQYTHSNPYARSTPTGCVDRPNRTKKKQKQTYRLIPVVENEHVIEQETTLDGPGWFEDPMTHDDDDRNRNKNNTNYDPTSSCSSEFMPAVNERGFQMPRHVDLNEDYYINHRNKSNKEDFVTIENVPVQRDFSKDWVHVAAVCDRLFFWFCLIFIVITTLMLFHPLTTSRYFKLPMLEKEP